MNFGIILIVILYKSSSYSSMMRVLTRLSYARNIYQTSVLRKPNQQPDRESNKPSENMHNAKKSDRGQEVKQKSATTKAIDQVNKYFLGIRMNTAYAKFNNEDTFENIAKFSGRKISDLPFKHQASEENVVIEGKIGKICSKILSKFPNKKLEDYLLKMSADYFTDLFEKKRSVKMEPNFQRQARRVIESLRKDGYNFSLTKNQSSTVKIMSAELFKGLEVTRNNNYAIDSYEIIKTDQYTFYKLYEKGSYKIPEDEWESQRNILMRITAEVSSPYSIKITNRTQKIQLKNRKHIFVFQMDLKRPPRFSNFTLTQAQHMKRYEPVLQNITITNVDQRNPYAAFTFQESQKKSSLINRLV